MTLAELLRRPEVSYEQLGMLGELPDLPQTVRRAVEVLVKYEGYLRKQQAAIERFERMEERLLPKDIDYIKLRGAVARGCGEIGQDQAPFSGSGRQDFWRESCRRECAHDLIWRLRSGVKSEMREFSTALEEGLAELGIEIAADQQVQLTEFARLVEDGNRLMNLTASPLLPKWQSSTLSTASAAC